MNVFKLFDKNIIATPDTDGTCKDCVFNFKQYKNSDGSCSINFYETDDSLLRCGHHNVIYKLSLKDTLKEL